MRHCREPRPSAAGLTTHHTLVLSNRERNEFAKPRQEWIQAAFDLKNGDLALFDKLVVAELCDNCIRSYEKSSIKTT